MSLVTAENINTLFEDSNLAAGICSLKLCKGYSLPTSDEPDFNALFSYLVGRYGKEFTMEVFIAAINKELAENGMLADLINSVLTSPDECDDSLDLEDEDPAPESVGQFSRNTVSSFPSATTKGFALASLPDVVSKSEPEEIRPPSSSGTNFVPTTMGSYKDFLASSKQPRMVEGSDHSFSSSRSFAAFQASGTSDRPPVLPRENSYGSDAAYRPPVLPRENGDDDDEKRVKVKFTVANVVEDAFDLDGFVRSLLKEINDPQLTAMKLTNTLRKIFSTQYKKPIYEKGTTIEDWKILTYLKNRIEEVGVTQVLAALTSKGMSIVSTTVLPTCEQFYGEDLELISDYVISSRSAKRTIYLDVQKSPVLQVSSKNYFEKVPNPLVWLVQGLIYIVTNKGIRESLVLKLSTKGGDQDTAWFINPALARTLDTCPRDLQSVIAAAKRLYAAGYKTIIGRSGDVEISVDDWVESVTGSHVDIAAFENYRNLDSTVQRLLSNWRVARTGTLLDESWFKHPYFFLRCGSKLLPYINTYVKFVDAYIPMIPSLEEMGKVATDRKMRNSTKFPTLVDGEIKYPVLERCNIVVIYGGVTLSRNLQYQAALDFFTALWGPPSYTAGSTRNVDAIWDMINFDLNPSVVARTTSCDACDADSVRSKFAKTCSEAYKVVVITDLASDSVMPSINLQAAKIAENFVSLPNVAMVSCKYCVVETVSVNCGGISAMNSSIQSPGMPVGRAHGMEGIFRVVPAIPNKRLLQKRTLYPFATQSMKKGDPVLKQAYLDRMQKMSLQQLAPLPFLDVDEKYQKYFPSSFNAVGRRDAKDYADDAADFWDETSLHLSD
jgi:hypothetical protein